ncbi:hypothetical protein HK101_006799 [Irineochytrium annulatum]|nr:hypothetical protein HK101_006799 [Irineochytrium annulatum]
MIALPVLLSLLPSALAFTHGTLLPPYLCNLKLQALGAPQSLADVIPKLVDSFTASNATAVSAVNLTDSATTIRTNASVIVSAFHHQKVWPFGAQKLCTANLGDGNALTSLDDVLLTVTAINQTQSIVGLIVWIQDRSEAVPYQIGNFADPGRNMTYYPYGCGDEATVVHTTTLHTSAPAGLKYMSPNMTWSPPEDGFATKQVSIRGICVTQAAKGQPGGGYGKFEVNVTIPDALLASAMGGGKDDGKDDDGKYEHPGKHTRTHTSGVAPTTGRYTSGAAPTKGGYTSGAAPTTGKYTSGAAPTKVASGYTSGAAPAKGGYGDAPAPTSGAAPAKGGYMGGAKGAYADEPAPTSGAAPAKGEYNAPAPSSAAAPAKGEYGAKPYPSSGAAPEKTYTPVYGASAAAAAKKPCAPTYH